MIMLCCTGTIEEVTRLAGEAVCVTPAICAWCWTGQTHTPAPVLVGALGAVPATLMSETRKEIKQNQKLFINNTFFSKPSVGLCVCEISQKIVDKNLLSQLFNKRRLHLLTQTCRTKLLKYQRHDENYCDLMALWKLYSEWRMMLLQAAFAHMDESEATREPEKRPNTPHARGHALCQSTAHLQLYCWLQYKRCTQSNASITDVSSLQWGWQTKAKT